MSHFQDDDLDFGITLDNGQSTQRKLSQVQPKTTVASIAKTISERQTQSNSHQTQNNRPQPLNSEYNSGKISEEGLSLSLSQNDYKLSNAAHPTVCIFTIIFKGSAIFTYMFLGYLISHVITFIMVVVLGAADFWLVKNIAGRLLVGMRWWSAYDQNGTQIWKFQSINQHNSIRTHINKVDKAFFWSTLLGNTVFWAILLLLKILTLNIFWGMLVAINFSLSAINLYGYYLCRGQKGHKQLKDYGMNIGVKGMAKLASVV